MGDTGLEPVTSSSVINRPCPWALCVGIFAARTGVDPDRATRRRMNRLRRFTLWAAASNGVDAKACFRLLRRAVRSKKQDPRPHGQQGGGPRRKDPADSA